MRRNHKNYELQIDILANALNAEDYPIVAVIGCRDPEKILQQLKEVGVSGIEYKPMYTKNNLVLAGHSFPMVGYSFTKIKTNG